jgi:membrane fusion protein (multidrug efflux system)
MKLRMNNRWILLGAAIVILLVGCEKPEETRETTKLVNVAVTTVQATAQVADTIEQPGVAIPDRIVTITAEVAGRVESVPVAAGDMVWAGADPTVLVKLNTDLLQAESDRCQADVTINKLRYERVEELFSRGGATEHERDQALANYQTAQALYDASQAKLERSIIYAPIEGTIDSLPVDEGEYLQPGAVIAEIVDTRSMTVVVEVSERNVSFLKLGDPATIIARQRAEDVPLIGEITFISKMLDPTTFTTRVEITVENTEGVLRPGLVDVILTRQILSDVIMVPLEVIVPREEDYVTYVIDDAVTMTLDVPASAAEDFEAGTSTVAIALPSGNTVTTTLDDVRLSPYGADYTRVEFALDNAYGSLASGDTLTVTLPGAVPLDLPIMEMHELDDQGPGEVMFLSPRAARRIVTIGLMRGTNIQITSGLEPGDELIVTGQQYVGPHQPVRITPKIADDSPDQPSASRDTTKQKIVDYHLQATIPQHEESTQVHADPKGLDE